MITNSAKLSRISSLGTTYEITQPPLILLGKKEGKKEASEEESKAILTRLERWALQSVARRILPDERVGRCMRSLKEHSLKVGVCQGAKRAYYTGLQVCGSIWICPVCAAKITEQRRVDLQNGMARWRGRHGEVLHLVQTVPHYDRQKLARVLVRFGDARRRQRNRKSWKRMIEERGLSGIVRALEVTYGSNGWHVHTHELLFVNSCSINIQEMTDDILEMWKGACVSAGLDRPNEHGVIIQDGSYADRYASKWGLESELTKAHMKKGNESGKTPWDILRAVREKGGGGNPELFVEYAKNFKGRHQLQWSKGLRDLLKMDSLKSDQDLAEEVEKEDVLLGSLTSEEWKVILRGDRRGELLLVAENEGWEGVVQYIGRVKEYFQGKR